jgi:hypothetical protein
MSAPHRDRRFSCAGRYRKGQSSRIGWVPVTRCQAGVDPAPVFGAGGCRPAHPPAPVWRLDHLPPHIVARPVHRRPLAMPG